MNDDKLPEDAVVVRARRNDAGNLPSSGPSISGDASWVPLVAFTATTFLSALLLFSIQPMFAKMALPVLGGAPSVWAVAMCFFQGALLAGYCYAHLLIARLPARTTGFVHLALCLLAFVALPIALPASFGEPPPGDAYLWQLGLFSVAVGLPFVAVAANAPLLQAWYAATRAVGSRDPYFLYAASNLGSLLALLSYPLVLEPAFGLKALSGYWSVGYALLVAALAGCFVLVRRGSPATATASHEEAPAEIAAPTWRQRAAWVGLALVPSALLTAFTNHVTTDIASAPLLWVLPLSLYLLTFVIVFRDRALIPPRLLLLMHLAAFLIAMFLIAQTRNESWFISASAGVAVFFTSALVAHRTLYEARPDARHLTEFYLWMSLGGVLGGIFAALVAPQIFSEVYEYPLLLALSFACRPGALDVSKWSREEGHWVWIVFASALLLIFWVPWAGNKLAFDFAGLGMAAALVGIFAAALLAFFQYPARQLSLALAMFLAVTMLPSTVRRGDAERSFFGVYRVSLSEDGEFNVLTHGTTLHGAQRVRDSDGNPVAETAPGTYYHPKSPMAETIRLRREALAARGVTKGRYGVVGLGAGSLACLSEEGEAWRFFEIDPVIVGIAAHSERFTYLANCQPNTDIVLGDARLTLAKEKPGSFDLIIVDAFSSDAVPVHLMTAEALRIYADKLAPDGLAVLHISNRYLDLEAVLGATREAVPELTGMLLSDEEADGSYSSTTSTVAVFSKSAAALEPVRALAGASDLDRGSLRPWTDDYSDILGPFMSKIRNR